MKLLSSHQVSVMNKILNKLPEDDKLYCNFTAYFQNTSSKENIWMYAYVWCILALNPIETKFSSRSRFWLNNMLLDEKGSYFRSSSLFVVKSSEFILAYTENYELLFSILSLQITLQCCKYDNFFCFLLAQNFPELFLDGQSFFKKTSMYRYCFTLELSIIF